MGDRGAVLFRKSYAIRPSLPFLISRGFTVYFVAPPFTRSNGLCPMASRIARVRRFPVVYRAFLRASSSALIHYARRNGLCRKASRIGRARGSLLYRVPCAMHSSLAFRILRSLSVLFAAFPSLAATGYAKRPAASGERDVFTTTATLNLPPRLPQRAEPGGQPHRACQAAPCVLPLTPPWVYVIGFFRLTAFSL